MIAGILLTLFVGLGDLYTMESYLSKLFIEYKYDFRFK